MLWPEEGLAGNFFLIISIKSMKLLSSNLFQIVKILSDLNYHDGDFIGEKLGITRSGVWKIIKKLQSYKIEINSVKSKGYQLESSLMLLDEKYIKTSLNNNILLEIFETIDSTSNYLKHSVRKSSIPIICLAEHQTSARGRHQRKWHAPFAQNLYFSYAFPVNKDLSELAGLSLVIGLAIISSLNEFDLPEKLELKWPNDIMYQNKKLVGILIDVLAESNSESYVIIGVGINANMKEDPDNIITQKWISLGEILNSYIDRSSLFIKVFKKITLYLQKFEEKGFEYFVDEYHNFDTLFGKEIKVISGNSEVKGKAIGINNRGNLKLELENGEIKICSSGDTSIVK